MAYGSATIDVVMPVHNEGPSIATTLHEFHRIVMLEGGQPRKFSSWSSESQLRQHTEFRPR